MRPKSYKAAKIKHMRYAHETNHNSPKYKRVCREFFKHFKDSQYTKVYGEVSSTNIDMMMKVSAYLKEPDLGFVAIKSISCDSTRDPNQIPFRVIMYFNGIMTMEVGRPCATSHTMMDQVISLMHSQDIASKVEQVEDNYNWYECGRRCNIQDIQDILTSILCGYTDEQLAYIMGVIIWWSSVICKQDTVKFAGIETGLYTDRCHYFKPSDILRAMSRAMTYSWYEDTSFVSRMRQMLTNPAKMAEYFGVKHDGNSCKATPEMAAPIYDSTDPAETN